MRLPKHATVVSYLALFVALGGTAYAATGGNFVLGHSNHAGRTTSLANSGSGAALKLSTKKKTTAPFAVSNGTKVSRLNADKVDGLSSGAFQRKVARIYASTSSATTGAQAAGSAGPWSFTLTCSPGGPAKFTVHGPGSVGGTTSIAAGGNAGTTYVGAPGSIGAGANSDVGTGAQMSLTDFLQSGSTIAEVQVLMTASTGGLFEDCTLIGDAAVIAS
jgi:hypothetical protein